jgi:hypothetical protein
MVRVAALALPPLPPSRVAAAAAYALEDRLATPADAAAIAVGERGRDGRVLAVVVARDFAMALLGVTPAFARAIAEPELAAPSRGWRWCESEHSAFVRTEDGSAFAVSRSADPALPAELEHALARAAHAGGAPDEVSVERVVEPTRLAEWTRATGVPFRAAAPWRWDLASADAFAGAVDVLSPLRRPAPGAAARSGTGLRIAAGTLAAAGVLHVAATLVTWGWSAVEIANVRRDLVPVAVQAGATGATPQTAAADIARVHAEARHRAGLAAPGDALPVLARAAPALAALPPGALKTATWNGGAWTLELAPLDDAALTALVERLADAGLAALHARTASGVRARVAP